MKLYCLKNAQRFLEIYYVMLNFIIGEGGIKEINFMKGNVSERNTENVCLS